MASSFILLLLELTLTTSLAVLSVAVLRKPLRRSVGAIAAYWIWLLVPGSAFAILLPAPSHSLGAAVQALPSVTLTAGMLGPAVQTAAAEFSYAEAVVLAWAMGSLVMAFIAVMRHRSFIRSLGTLIVEPDGTCRSHAGAGPMLVGVWRSRIVLPADFEHRYSSEERQLVLSHEHAHLDRKDVLVNAVAAVFICLFWFNPLMYWAVRRIRIDQELACDALVLSGPDVERRRYANALLKTQLSADAVAPAPIGCHWQSTHPLKERIAMLKQPLPGVGRRFAGIAAALLLSAAGTYAAWASQPSASEGKTALKDIPYQIAAENMSVSPAGRISLSGNVTLTPLKKDTNLEVQARRTERIEGNATLFTGSVVFVVGDHTVATDRATVTAEGVLKMDAAEVAPRAKIARD